MAVLALAQVRLIPYFGFGYIAAGLLAAAGAFPAAALAGLALIPVLVEAGKKWTLMVYAAAAALSLLLMVLVFVCTGIINRFGGDEEGSVIV